MRTYCHRCPIQSAFDVAHAGMRQVKNDSRQKALCIQLPMCAVLTGDEASRFVPPAQAGATDPVGDDADEDAGGFEVTSAATGGATTTTANSNEPAPLNKAFWKLENASTVDQTVMDYQCAPSFARCFLGCEYPATHHCFLIPMACDQMVRAVCSAEGWSCSTTLKLQV